MKRLFKESHPKLFQELHPLKNRDVDFSIIYENSGRKVWWKCRINQNHVWEQSITNRVRKGYGCPFCSGRLTLAEESFATLFPAIASELHPTNNKDINPYECRPKSNKLVWWKCNKGHEWQQTINYRVSHGRKCIICRRQENSLASKYPEIASEWHPTKNKGLLPYDILPSYKKKVWWKCQKDPSHKWEATVSTRAFSKSTCPICRKQSKNHIQLPTLDKYLPSLAKQWHPTKNKALKPSDIKPNSSKKAWWVCPIDPTHEWESIIRNRAIQNKGCPFCAKHKVTLENSLVKRFPEIAGQWHPTKNSGLKPSDFSYGSHKRVWWQCIKDKSHEWQATINGRTQRNRVECPICSKGTYAVSNSLQSVHPDIAAQWHPTKNGSLKPSQVTRASGKKVWWQCPENPNHEWEAQIKNRTLLGAGCQICFKEKNIIRLSGHLFNLVHSEIDHYHVFLSNINTLKNLSEQDFKFNQRLKQPYYRMIYSSVITSLEAYLSDAFYKKVLNNDEILEKFINTNPEFQKRQYSLTEVIDWHKNLRKKVTEYLFDIIWHNLSKVQNMYRDVLGVNFPEDITHLYRAVTIRHDIVHRNGRTRSGSFHKIDKSQLLQLISDVKHFVIYLNNQLLGETEPGASPDGY